MENGITKIHACGLMRSGNHAILRWLCGCCTSQSKFYNNVITTLYEQCEVWNEHLPHSLSVVSFENQHPDKHLTSDINIIIMRDPYNWLASYIEHKDFNEIVIPLYIEHYEYILTHKDCVFINFNDWFQHKEYRVKLCEALNLQYNEDELNVVSGIGGGSSFDKLQYNGRAREMKVLDRWQQYRNDEMYLYLFKKYTILQIISQSLFHFEPSI